MEIIFELSKVALVPIIVSVIVRYVGKTKKIHSSGKKTQQMIIGVVFGLVTIFANEFSVKVNGVNINVRDASPLIAALIFGGPAGEIAGIIGAIERWFCVYWGGGTYTRLACTLGTLFAGIIGSYYRRKIYDDKTPLFYHGLIVAATVEVIHLLLVFITNLEEPLKAYEVVESCAIPMILVNSLTVMIAVGINNLIHLRELKNKKEKPQLSELIQRYLLAVMIIAFVFTSYISVSVQNGITEADNEELLRVNVQDVIDNVSDLTDESLLDSTRTIAQVLENTEDLSIEHLRKIADEMNVTDINIINSNGIITISSEADFVGFDMLHSGDQAAQFMNKIIGRESYIQPYQEISYGGGVYRKYAGIAFKGGYLQIGYDAENFQKSVADELMLAVKNRHIDADGKIIVADADYIVVADSEGNSGYTLESIGLTDDKKADSQMEVLETIINGENCYYCYGETEGYYIIAYMTVEYATISQDVANFLTIFMDVLILGGIFTQVVTLLKKLFVDNVDKVDSSLLKITSGNLDTEVNVRQTKEFDSLSTGINETVSTLKRYIAEAEERISNELNYAKEIQKASLPNIFPAFPDHDEFDLFASMDPAKSVGGDFYDFYLIDESHLGILIADVSGKGIPAALFMMKAKAFIKTYATYGMSVEDVFTNANYNLCEGNDAEMFVTAWMGILDLRTGLLEYANAGHNPPLIRHDGQYEYLRSKPGFVLAGMEGVVYRKQTIQVEPGDEIYLYTDGITEAHNQQGELFGEDRLKETINQCDGFDCLEICHYIKNKVDEFADGADQFDDQTMLSLHYLKKQD